MACRFSELAVDGRDPESLSAWWSEVLGHRVRGREPDGSVGTGPEEGFGGPAPALVFGPVAEPTTGTPWLHVLADPEAPAPACCGVASNRV